MAKKNGILLLALVISGCATWKQNAALFLGAPLTWKTAALFLGILVFILAVALSAYVWPDKQFESTMYRPESRWSSVRDKLSVWIKVVAIVLFIALAISDHFLPKVTGGEEPGPNDGPTAMGD